MRRPQRPASAPTRAAQPRQRGIPSKQLLRVEQPDRRVRHLVGAEHARTRPDDRRLRLARSLARHVGVGPVGADHVHVDRHSGGHQLALERGGEAPDRVLGRGVDRQAGHRRERGHRSEVDHVHVLATTAPHGVYGRARAPDHPEHVDLGDQADLVVGLVPDLARAQHAGVVDPDLERPALGGGARRAPVRLGIAHVDLHREAADLLRGRGCRVDVDVRGEHRVAAVGQPLRDLAPEAAAGAGDHRDAGHQAAVAASGGRAAGSGRLTPRRRLRSRASVRM